MIKQFGKFHTISNYISLSRLLVVFPIMLCIEKFHVGYEYRIYALGFMAIGYITDLLDGYFARKYNQISEWGKIIDPFADKVAIIFIVFKLYQEGYITDLYFWVIAMRDILIFAGGIVVSNIIGKVLPSNLLGKFTIFTIGAYLLGVVLNLTAITWLHDILYYTSLVLSFASVIGYSIRSIESIRWYSKNETF